MYSLVSDITCGVGDWDTLYVNNNTYYLEKYENDIKSNYKWASFDLLCRESVQFEMILILLSSN
jgi:hypothetical protein